MIGSGELNPFPTLEQSAKLKSNQLKISSDVTTIKETLRLLHQRVTDEFKSFISSLLYSSESIEILLLQRAHIVFCTLVSSGRPWLKKHISGVDVLIVDEASQCTEPEALIPLKFQPKKCLHVGDPKQLPATVISLVAKERSYDDSMMLRMMELCRQAFQMLSVQYRMHPAICDWPSSRYYKGQLRSSPGLADRPSPLADAPIAALYKTPCIFFDVKGDERRDVGYSKSIDNPKEAEALIRALSLLLPYLAGKEIGVITFYAAQVVLLKNRFRTIKAPHKDNVTISTVDSFQGEEKDIIFLSTVRACQDVGFLKDIRRLNVAITRPRHHLYIFGNGSALMASKTDFTGLIEHYEKNSGANYKVAQQPTGTKIPSI
jgi:senataxin